MFLDVFVMIHRKGVTFWHGLEIPTYTWPWKRKLKDDVLWSDRYEKFYPSLTAFDKEHVVDRELLKVMRGACEDEMRRLGEIV